MKTHELAAIVIILGIAVTITGMSFLSAYWSDYSNDLGTITTNINAGWSSNMISDAKVQMWIAPNYFGRDDNFLEIALLGTADTNRSFDNATFILLVPFDITSILGHSNDTDSVFFAGNWSIQNIGSSATAVYYELQPPANNSFMPSWENINTVVDLRFKHLPSLYNHGSYTAVIPFGGGVGSLDTLFAMKIVPSLPFGPVNLDKNITLSLLMKGNLVLTSSFPEYVSQHINMGLPYHNWNESESMLSLNYGSASPLTVTFQDMDEINTSFLEQALAFTLLGVGIPTIVSGCVELVKTREDTPNQEVTRALHKSHAHDEQNKRAHVPANDTPKSRDCLNLFR